MTRLRLGARPRAGVQLYSVSTLDPYLRQPCSTTASHRGHYRHPGTTQLELQQLVQLPGLFTFSPTCLNVDDVHEFIRTRCHWHDTSARLFGASSPAYRCSAHAAPRAHVLVWVTPRSYHAVHALAMLGSACKARSVCTARVHRRRSLT